MCCAVAVASVVRSLLAANCLHRLRALLSSTAEEVDEHHLFEARTSSSFKARACHHYCQNLGAGDGNVQPVLVEKEADAAGRGIAFAGGH